MAAIKLTRSPQRKQTIKSGWWLWNRTIIVVLHIFTLKYTAKNKCHNKCRASNWVYSSLCHFQNFHRQTWGSDL